jgi:hypothetical protein
MLDRKLQRELLTKMAEHYPRAWDFSDYMRDVPECDQQKLAANLQYLDEHGLAKSGILIGLGGLLAFSHPQITAQGMDFLQDDGGLSAILGVITIRLHDDTIKSLVEAKIRDSDLPQTEKSRLVSAVRALPAEVTKHLTLKLVDIGLAQSHVALQTILKAVGVT